MDRKEVDEEVAVTTQREKFWLKAATWTFGLWALMLPITAKLILDGQKDLASGQKELADRFQAYRELDQTSMALLKDRQDAVIERQRTIMKELKELQDHDNGRRYTPEH